MALSVFSEGLLEDIRLESLFELCSKVVDEQLMEAAYS